MNYEERKELCANFFGMVEVVVDEFLSRSRNQKYKQHREDLMGIGLVALRRASIKFDTSRGLQFNTYASNAIRYEMIHYLNRLNRINEMEVPMSSVLDSDNEPRVFGSYDEENLYEGMIDGLAPDSEKDKIIYYSVIIHGEPIRDVAKEVGLSIMKTVYAKKRILNEIRSKLGEPTI